MFIPTLMMFIPMLRKNIKKQYPNPISIKTEDIVVFFNDDNFNKIDTQIPLIDLDKQHENRMKSENFAIIHISYQYDMSDIYMADKKFQYMLTNIFLFGGSVEEARKQCFYNVTGKRIPNSENIEYTILYNKFPPKSELEKVPNGYCINTVKHENPGFGVQNGNNQYYMFTHYLVSEQIYKLTRRNNEHTQHSNT